MARFPCWSRRATVPAESRSVDVRNAVAMVVLGLVGVAVGCGRTEPYDLRIPEPRYPDGGRVLELDGGMDGGVDAGPLAACVLLVSPPVIDFGQVPLGSPIRTEDVTVTDIGDAGCSLGDIQLSTGSDPEFHVTPPMGSNPTLLPGETIQLGVRFTATSSALPRLRTATLNLQKAGPQGALSSVGLQATITVGCLLQATPNPLDFGNVSLNTNAAATLTLSNPGDAPCDISHVALDSTGSALFSLPNPSTFPFEVAAGDTGSTTIPVAFAGDDSTAPHQRFTNLFFTVTQPTGLPRLPTHQETVPVQAYINTACMAGSQWIYTVDALGTFSIFDPQSLTFTNIGPLICIDPDASATPFSMAVDQNTVAWVEYTSGNIYQVDTVSLSCTPTSYQVDPNLKNFGMGFVFEPSTGLDTLYVAGLTDTAFKAMYNPSTLATISFPSLTLSPIGPIGFGAPELTGTGDGQLWGFAPATESVNRTDILAQIDPATGNVITSYTYSLNASGGYAMKFWGGSLWIFIGETIFQVDRTNGSIQVALTNSGHDVVGAGVSTCAPLQ